MITFAQLLKYARWLKKQEANIEDRRWILEAFILNMKNREET
jgi:hypothetical protein